MLIIQYLQWHIHHRSTSTVSQLLHNIRALKKAFHTDESTRGGSIIDIFDFLKMFFSLWSLFSIQHYTYCLLNCTSNHILSQEFYCPSQKNQLRNILPCKPLFVVDIKVQSQSSPLGHTTLFCCKRWGVPFLLEMEGPRGRTGPKNNKWQLSYSYYITLSDCFLVSAATAMTLP